MSRLTIWLAERQLDSKTAGSRLQAIKKLRSLMDVSCLPVIQRALENSDAQVRCEAVHALGDFHDESVLPAFLRALTDRDESVQLIAISYLRRLGSPAARDALAQKLAFGSEAVQVRAALALESLSWQPKSVEEQIRYFVALGKFDRLTNLGPRALKPLADVLRDGPTERRLGAAAALGKLGGPEVLPHLTRALKDGLSQVRTAAAYALAATDLPECIPALLAALRDHERNVRIAVVSAVGSFRDASAVEPLIAMLEDKDWEVRTVVLEALGKIRDSRAASFVAGKLEDADASVREVATDTLGRVGDESILEKLVLTSIDENLGVRQAAIRALQRVAPDWHRTQRAQHLLPKLRAALKHRDTSVQQAAASLIQLLERRKPAAEDALLPGDRPGPEAQRSSARQLLLEELLHEADPVCRAAAMEAITQLQLTVQIDFLALAELKNVSVESVVLADADGEIWFQRDCPDLTSVRRSFGDVPRRAAQLTALLNLGEFRRLELRTDRRRHLVVCALDRNLHLGSRLTPPGPALVPEAVPAGELSGWLQQAPTVRGVLVRAIRFADATVACDLDSRAFPAAQLEQAFRSVGALFDAPLPDGTRPVSVTLQFDRTHLHCARRPDGTLLGIFASPKDADLAGIEKQLREFVASAPLAAAA